MIPKGTSLPLCIPPGPRETERDILSGVRGIAGDWPHDYTHMTSLVVLDGVPIEREEEQAIGQ